MTPAVATFLLGLLSSQQLSVGAPDFDHALAEVLAAREALVAVINAAPAPLVG